MGSLMQYAILRDDSEPEDLKYLDVKLLNT